jgi:hypothetical protein
LPSSISSGSIYIPLNKWSVFCWDINVCQITKSLVVRIGTWVMSIIRSKLVNDL